MKRIFYILLSLILFIGAVGVPLAKHLCKGRLQSITLLSVNSGCHHEEASSSCHHSEKPHCSSHQKDSKVEHSKNTCCSKTKKDCCSDDYSWSQLDIDLITNDIDFSLDKLDLFLPKNAIAVKIEENLRLEPLVDVHYRPPPPPKQTTRRALLQVFLC